MKVCLLLEYRRLMNGALYRKIGTGLLSSYANQRDVLRSLGFDLVEDWDDSCDILQANTPGPLSVSLMRRAKRLGKKVIAWAHITAEDSIGVFRVSRLAFPLTRRYLARAYNQADIVFCPTEHTKNLVAAYGISRDKLIVLSNGVNTGKYIQDVLRRDDYRQRYGLSGVVVGTVGLAIPRKGIDTFLALARKYPDVQFIWYGKIYSSLMSPGLPKDLPANVQFTGYVDDAVAAINSLDIFLFPSYEENQGMAILEAASTGRPILVRNLPAYDGWLVDGDNCLIAEDDAGFERHLALLLADASLRDRLGESATVLARRESVDEVAKRLLGHYERLLDTPIQASAPAIP